jgi:hypothetical protein
MGGAVSGKRVLPAGTGGRMWLTLYRSEAEVMHNYLALNRAGLLSLVPTSMASPTAAAPSIGWGYLAGHHKTAGLDTPDRCVRWVILWIEASSFTEFAPVARRLGHGMEDGEQLRPVRDLIIISRHEQGPSIRK